MENKNLEKLPEMEEVSSPVGPGDDQPKSREKAVVDKVEELVAPPATDGPGDVQPSNEENISPLIVEAANDDDAMSAVWTEFRKSGLENHNIRLNSDGYATLLREKADAQIGEMFEDIELLNSGDESVDEKKLQAKYAHIFQITDFETCIKIGKDQDETSKADLINKMVGMLLITVKAGILNSAQSIQNIALTAVSACKAQEAINKGLVLNEIKALIDELLADKLDFDKWADVNIPTMRQSTRNKYILLAIRVDVHRLVPFGIERLFRLCVATSRMLHDGTLQPDDVEKMLRDNGIDPDVIANRDWDSDEEFSDFSKQLDRIIEAQYSLNKVMSDPKVREKLAGNPDAFDGKQYFNDYLDTITKAESKGGKTHRTKADQKAIAGAVKEAIISGTGVGKAKVDAEVDAVYDDKNGVPKTHNHINSESRFDDLDEILTRGNDYLIDLGLTLENPEKNQMIFDLIHIIKRVIKIRDSANRIMLMDLGFEFDQIAEIDLKPIIDQKEGV